MDIPVLSDDEVETLGAIADRIYPPGEDAHADPGADDLGAVRYILAALAGPYRRQLSAYREGLAALDARAVAASGHRFAALDAAEQDGLLERVESGTAWPGAGAFFALIRQHVLEGVFGDPRHGGNRDRLAWQAVGYPGARLAHDPADLECVHRAGETPALPGERHLTHPPNRDAETAGPERR